MCLTLLCVHMHLTFIDHHLYGDSICFANVAFLESIQLTPMNGSLSNINTWRVSVGNRTLQKDFLGICPKLPIFDNFTTQWQLWGPISLARNKVRQLGNGVGNYEGSPTSSQKFMNFGPLLAKNRTIVFTYPPKILQEPTVTTMEVPMS